MTHQKGHDLFLRSRLAAILAESLWLSVRGIKDLRLRRRGRASKHERCPTESQRLSARIAAKPQLSSYASRFSDN